MGWRPRVPVHRAAERDDAARRGRDAGDALAFKGLLPDVVPLDLPGHGEDGEERGARKKHEATTADARRSSTMTCSPSPSR